MFRLLAVSGLLVLGMAGSALALAGTGPGFCHAPTFAALPATEVSNMFDLNKAGLTTHLHGEKMMFTTAGYQGYLAALRRSGTLAAVHDGVKITAQPDGPRQMTGPCDAPTVRVPSRFTYVVGKKVYHRQHTVVLHFVADPAIPMLKIAQMVVIPPLKSPRGTE